MIGGKHSTEPPITVIIGEQEISTPIMIYEIVTQGTIQRLQRRVDKIESDINRLNLTPIMDKVKNLQKDIKTRYERS